MFPGSAAAAPLLDGLGGPAGYGPRQLRENDDGSSDEIDIRAAFPGGLRFFSATYTSLFVNNNGNISFGNRLPTYTPRAFPIASQPIIAPWWGDVDTRGGGAPIRNGVYWSITPGRIVVTWHDVGYFSRHDNLQNDFQLILTAAPSAVGDFDVEFRYNRCEWTTGDASGGDNGFGGTPAQAGFDAGNLRDYVALPGSLTASVLRLCTTSNVGVPGVWRFEIREGTVMCAGRGDACSTGLPGLCEAGTLVCVSPEEAMCRADASPRDERCNDVDDDCDGSTDEGFASRFELCNGIDDDCNGVVDDALVDCTPPDGGWPEPDASTTNDGGPRCVGPACDPWVLQGRAGPIGRCNCRVTSRRGVPPLPAAFALALAAAIAIRRRR